MNPLKRFLARLLLGIDPREIEEMRRALAETTRELSKVRSAGLAAEKRVISSTVLMRMSPEAMSKAIDKPRKVINGVVIVASPDGLIRIRFRPFNASTARKVISELRKMGGEVIGSEITMKVTKIRNKSLAG